MYHTPDAILKKKLILAVTLFLKSPLTLCTCSEAQHFSPPASLKRQQKPWRRGFLGLQWLKKKRVEPQEAASGSSLFLICTWGRLCKLQLATPYSHSGVLLSPFQFHSWYSSTHLASSTHLCSHDTFCRPPQGSVLLFSESDSFSAALSFPYAYALFQECALPFNNLCSIAQTPPFWSYLTHSFFLSLAIVPYLNSGLNHLYSFCIRAIFPRF